MHITMELLLLILITLVIINQIVIILEKEKLEGEIVIVLKLIHKKPLTKEEQKYVKKHIKNLSLKFFKKQTEESA